MFNWARSSDQKLMEQADVFLSALNAWAHFASSKGSQLAKPDPKMLGASTLMPANGIVVRELFNTGLHITEETRVALVYAH